MKKISVIIFAIIIFVLAYQIRSDFLLRQDYNEPGDSSEFRGAEGNAVASIREYLSGNISFNAAAPWLIGALDSHNSPVVNSINTFITLFLPGQREFILLILSSAFVVVLFFISRRFFSLSISITLALIAAVYTPLYAFIYSYMLESFGSVIAPLFTFAAIFFALRSSRSILFSFLTGLCLATLALYRIEFRWVGIPFVAIWFISFYRKPLVSAVVMFSTYLIITAGWMVIARVVTEHSYYQLGGNVMMVLYNTYNYATYGWMFDTVPIRSPSELIPHILRQGPLHLIWLQFAQMIRLWTRPATMYIGEYPMVDRMLFLLHYVILLFALFGLRKIFFSRIFLFLAIPLFWATALAFNPEELRRQVPLVATVILFMGAGIAELQNIFLQKKYRYIIIALLVFSFLIIFESKIAYGIISWFYPKFLPSYFLRVIIIGAEFILLAIATKGLLRFDRRSPMLFKHRLVRKIPAFIPLIFFIIVVSYQSKNYLWYEWRTNLLPFHRIEQTITLGAKEIASLKKQKGYLLIDIKDADSGKNLDISINNKRLKDSLFLRQAFSPIDLFVLRQFQRGMPRLGFGKIEDEVASLSALPNVHQWLIYKVDGELLRDKNIVVVSNKSYSYKNAFIYGDYFIDSFPHRTYKGPTAQIFQGPISFYKYQVDEEIRLPRKSFLFSIKNESKLINHEGKYIDDLSNQFGLQRGRYRIFLLFPYLSGDPNEVF